MKKPSSAQEFGDVFFCVYILIDIFLLGWESIKNSVEVKYGDG